MGCRNIHANTATLSSTVHIHISIRNTIYAQNIIHMYLNTLAFVYTLQCLADNCWKIFCIVELLFSVALYHIQKSHDFVVYHGCDVHTTACTLIFL